MNACWPDTIFRYIALTNQTTYEVARRKRIFYLRYATIEATCFVISIFFIVEIIAEWCNEAVPLAGGYLKEFIHSVKAYAEICTTSVVLARKDLF